MSGVTNDNTSVEGSDNLKVTNEMNDSKPQTANGDVGQNDKVQVEESTTKIAEGDSSKDNSNTNITPDGNVNDSGKVTAGDTDAEKGDKPAEEDNEHYAVFVMNIPLTVGEDDVRKHFEKDVPVKSVSLVYAPNGKFRGYATVELLNKAAYEGALKLMGSKLDTLYLYVVPHRSMTKPQENKDDTRPFKILVTNISKSVNLLEAKRHFYPAGLIRRFVAKTHGKNPGMAGFDHDWAATIKVNKLETFTNILEMDGSMLGGQAIKVEPLVVDKKGVYKRLSETAEELEEDSKEQKLSDFEDQENDSESQFRIFVGNLPHSVTSQQVIEHLKQAGEVVSCWMPDELSTRKRPKIAFVTMADEESYKKALELTGSTLEENTLKINPFVKGKSREGRAVAEPDWLKKPLILVLSNIPVNAREGDVRKHFDCVGTIECVRFPRDRSLKVAYIELRDMPSYEKALELSTSFMGLHCISVMPTTSPLVPKHWLDMSAQRRKGKKVNRKGNAEQPPVPARKGKKKGGKPIPEVVVQKGGRKAKRGKRKMGSDFDFNPMYNSPAKRMKKGNTQNQRRGGMNRASYDSYVTSYGYGGDFYDQGWNDDYRASSFKRPGKILQASKRKEIEQVALAALNELEARKSGMNNYYGGSSHSYGSNYSHGSNNSSYY